MLPAIAAEATLASHAGSSARVHGPLFLGRAACLDHPKRHNI
jgi:hypothetical protein